MARRAKYGRYDSTDFKDFIKFVLADLDIKGSVKFKFGDFSKFDGRHYHTSFYSGKYADHWVLINRDNTRARIMEVIAHELRHAYQYQANLLSWNGNTRNWRGIDYPNAIELGTKGKTKGSFSSVKYRDQPWEKDANDYADYIVEFYSKSLM